MSNYERAIEFAKSVGAKIVLPTDPKYRPNYFAKTDIEQTWRRLTPHGDFDNVRKK